MRDVLTEVILVKAESVPEGVDPKRILCLDCGGWPIPGGAMFIPVVVCQNGESISAIPANERKRFTPLAHVGFVCELCFLWRLERRAKLVSATSTPKAYYSFKKAQLLLREAADRAGKVGR